MIKTLLGAAVLGVVPLTAGCVPPPAAPGVSAPTTATSTTTATATTTSTTSTTSTTTGTPPTPPGAVTVSPGVETPDRQPSGVNDADDAAIWVHPTTPRKSLILATIKTGGLDVYRPDGTVVQTIGAGGGRFNNVDLVYPAVAGDQTPGLAIVSDRATDKLHVFRGERSSSSPPVTEVTAANVPLVFGTTQPVTSKTAYGVAAWTTPAGTVEVFVSQENTTNLQKLVLTGVERQRLVPEGGIEGEPPNTFTMPDAHPWTPCFNPSHPDWQAHVEGMVVDPATGILWADQELVGLWKITTDLGSSQLVHKITRYGQTWTVNNGTAVF